MSAGPLPYDPGPYASWEERRKAYRAQLVRECVVRASRGADGLALDLRQLRRILLEDGDPEGAAYLDEVLERLVRLRATLLIGKASAGAA